MTNRSPVQQALDAVVAAETGATVEIARRKAEGFNTRIMAFAAADLIKQLMVFEAVGINTTDLIRDLAAETVGNPVSNDWDAVEAIIVKHLGGLN